MTLLNLQIQEQPSSNTAVHGVCAIFINTCYYLVIEFLAASSNDAFPKEILQKMYLKHLFFPGEV